MQSLEKEYEEIIIAAVKGARGTGGEAEKPRSRIPGRSREAEKPRSRIPGRSREAEKPRSRIPGRSREAEKPRSREAEFPGRSREAEKPKSREAEFPGEAEKPRSRIPRALRSALHRYTHCAHVETCDVTRVQSATEWTASLYTHCIHVGTCDVTRIQSATEWTASVYTLCTCRNVCCHSCSQCYGMDCIAIHTAYMSERVMSLVFKALRNGLHRCTHCAHVETCDVTRVHRATEWTASVYTLRTCRNV